MSIEKNYYVIAGFDLTKHKTEKYEDWKWTDEGENFICYQSKGNIQLFDDPMNGEHLYLGYILANGDEYCFDTTKFDMGIVNEVRYDIGLKLVDLIDLELIKRDCLLEIKYQVIVFEECY